MTGVFLIILGWHVGLFLVLIQSEGIALDFAIDDKHFAIVLLGLLEKLAMNGFHIICYFERIEELNGLLKIAHLTTKFSLD